MRESGVLLVDDDDDEEEEESFMEDGSSVGLDRLLRGLHLVLRDHLDDVGLGGQPKS